MTTVHGAAEEFTQHTYDTQGRAPSIGEAFVAGSAWERAKRAEPLSNIAKNKRAFDTSSSVPWFRQDETIATIYDALMAHVPEGRRSEATDLLSLLMGLVEGRVQ